MFRTAEGYIFYCDGEKYFLMGYCGRETEPVLPDTVRGSSYAVYKRRFRGAAT